jgi:hypothetical protein
VRHSRALKATADEKAKHAPQEPWFSGWKALQGTCPA